MPIMPITPAMGSPSNVRVLAACLLAASHMPYIHGVPATCLTRHSALQTPNCFGLIRPAQITGSLMVCWFSARLLLHRARVDDSWYSSSCFRVLRCPYREPVLGVSTSNFSACCQMEDGKATHCHLDFAHL
jgi:hypothetical protein